MIIMIIWSGDSDFLPVNHQTMINAFAAAFYKMGLIGQGNNHNVSNWLLNLKFILATKHDSHS